MDLQRIRETDFKRLTEICLENKMTYDDIVRNVVKEINIDLKQHHTIHKRLINNHKYLSYLIEEKEKNGDH